MWKMLLQLQGTWGGSEGLGKLLGLLLGNTVSITGSSINSQITQDRVLTLDTWLGLKAVLFTTVTARDSILCVPLTTGVVGF